MAVDLHEQILEYIDRLLHPLMLHEMLPLKTKSSIELISRIIKESNKTVPEAVLVFLAVLRYLRKDSNADSRQEFIKANSHLIFKMAIEKRVQANLPGRALPLFDIFEKKIRASSISVIELGASYGLIGRCLLNPTQIIEKKNDYFSPRQQIPQSVRSVNYYLGIELSPPDRDWVLACEWHPVLKERLKNFLNDINADEKFKIIIGDAFGFSNLDAVKDIASQNAAVIVFTSFMLYQYNDKKQKQLRDEILEFIKGGSRHWINQTLNVSSLECFIELDEEKIIGLSDASCSAWKWLS
jgi:hypothetical protein